MVGGTAASAAGGGTGKSVQDAQGRGNDGSGSDGATDRLRVAVVGGGPAGFYGAAALLKAGARVDLFEKLPAPHGLVRYGVAPDHQKIKGAARAFDKTARQPGFRYFGNVEVGRDLELSELQARYDQVLVTIGAAADRRMGIAGEDLEGSVSAVAVVGWYNGHPELAEGPPLDGSRVVVVGMGNVALDVARVLVRDPAELEETDIDPGALEALRKSQVEEVVLLGRRGPAQAAFDLSELMELTELSGVQVGVSDPTGALASHTAVEGLDSATAAKVRFIAELPRADDLTAPRRIVLRFLASPKELLGDAHGRVTEAVVERNELSGPPDQARARGTGETEVLPANLVIRSIGYRAVPLPGLPFSEQKAVVPNADGRVLDGEGRVVPGLYVAGWIKRGPTGLIGTNKSCAQDTVRLMLEDAQTTSARNEAAESGHPSGTIEDLLRQRGARVVDYDDWLRIEAAEVQAGQALGRVRLKTRDRNELLAWLDAGAARSATR